MTTTKGTTVSEKKRTAGLGVLALAGFAGWMWHAAEIASPGITGTETERAGSALAGAGGAVIDSGRTLAQESGVGNMLADPTAATQPQQLGGVAGGGQ